jgi:uncharacterized protein (TIGR02246 family)
LKNRITILAALSVAVILSGCAQAPPPAPPDTRDADAKAIRETEETWNKDWAAKDVNKIASHYADDATLLPPGMAGMNGKAAIMPVLTDMIKDPNLTLSFTATKVEVAKSSDIGYTQGNYSMTMTDPKTKKVATERGGYVTIYKKQADGSWKAIEDINTPAAPAK